MSQALASVRTETPSRELRSPFTMSYHGGNRKRKFGVSSRSRSKSDGSVRHKNAFPAALSPLPKYRWDNSVDFGEHDVDSAEPVTAAGRQTNNKGWRGQQGDDPNGSAVINALIILNTDCVGGSLFRRFWAHSTLRVCADGGGNRLYDSLGKVEREDFVPMAINGDLDSLREEVADWYRARGTQVVKNADQDSNDLEKCLEFLKGQEAANKGPGSSGGKDGVGLRPWEREQVATRQSSRLNVFVLGALGQRFDHTMANCHILYRYSKVFRRLVLLGEESLAFLLPAGRHWIVPDARTENPVCGLIPMGQPCTSIRTRGLRWELRGEAMAMGSLVSTSNERVMVDGGGEGEGGEEGREGERGVWIENSDPVIWTSGLKKEWQKGS